MVPRRGGPLLQLETGAMDGRVRVARYRGQRCLRAMQQQQRVAGERAGGPRDWGGGGLRGG